MLTLLGERSGRVIDLREEVGGIGRGQGDRRKILLDAIIEWPEVGKNDLCPVLIHRPSRTEVKLVITVRCGGIITIIVVKAEDAQQTLIQNAVLILGSRNASEDVELEARLLHVPAADGIDVLQR
jgi:hypothetical protein